MGLVLPGMQCVRDTMGKRWLYQNDRMFKELAEWMPEFHKYGGKLFIQLAAGFGRSMAVNGMMVNLLKNPTLGKLAKPFLDVEYCCASASETPNRWVEGVNSRPMTVEEIHEMVEAFGKTAKKLRDAGVDGVEIHAVHEGYLLDQFTIANWNYRKDEYGGSFENRFRFPVEIVQCIHKYAGDDFPVSLRYSVVSKTKGWYKGAMPGEDFVEFGRDMAESEKAVKYLEEAGYAMFNCDNGTYDAWYWAHPPQYMPDNCNITEVEHIKNFTNAPVVCAGRMDPVFAAEEIAAGRLDAVAIARQNLVDPEWIDKILAGKAEDIKPCIRCHNGCFNFAKYKGTANIQSMEDSLHLARCALTPPTMQHNRYKIVPTTKPKKVAIVGGGIGGMECALVLKQRGHVPTIFEKTGDLGGAQAVLEQEQAHQRHQAADDRHRQIGVGGPDRPGGLLLDDPGIGGEGHDLEEYESREQICGQEHAHGGAKGHEIKEIVAAAVMIVGKILVGQKHGHKPHQGDDHNVDLAEAVELHVQAQRADPRQGLGAHRPERQDERQRQLQAGRGHAAQAAQRRRASAQEIAHKPQGHGAENQKKQHCILLIPGRRWPAPPG